MPEATLHHGDCPDVLPAIPSSSIDLICSDLPYSATRCTWDEPIPLDRLWDQYRRVLKPDGVVVLTATMKVAVQLITSAPANWFRYDLAWDKVVIAGHLDARRKPLRRHESVLVFAPEGRTTYNPQMTTGDPYRARKIASHSSVYHQFANTHTDNTGTRYPQSIVRFSNRNLGGKRHPSEKPVDLMAWLVLTFSDPGDVVLDNAMGSGSTGETCQRCGRDFIGIERDAEYFGVARERLASV